MSKDEVLIRNRVKELLKSGEAIRAFNVFESLRPSVASVLAQTGYEMVLVEVEHILHNPETLTNFLVLSSQTRTLPDSNHSRSFEDTGVPNIGRRGARIVPFSLRNTGAGG